MAKIAALVRNGSRSGDVSHSGQRAEVQPGEAQHPVVRVADREHHPGVKDQVQVLAIGASGDPRGNQLVVGIRPRPQVIPTVRCCPGVSDPEAAEVDSSNPSPTSRWRVRLPTSDSHRTLSKNVAERSGICSRSSAAGRDSVVLSTLDIVTDRSIVGWSRRTNLAAGCVGGPAGAAPSGPLDGQLTAGERDHRVALLGCAGSGAGIGSSGAVGPSLPGREGRHHAQFEIDSRRDRWRSRDRHARARPASRRARGGEVQGALGERLGDDRPRSGL